MSAAAWIALAVAAVLGFWMLGAYNRLVSLRNAVAAAWAQADEAQRRRAEGAQALVAVLRKPLDGEQGALDALWAAQNASARAAGAMSARPLATANAAAWAEAERKLGAAAARVFALAES
ncbi:MAG: LemA family protein, partial [Rubrivivax sp.]